MRLFQQLFVAGALLAATPSALAANWSRYETCQTNQGQFWLDRATDGPWKQIVIHDDELIQYLVDKEALADGDINYQKRELVMGTFDNGAATLHFTGEQTHRAGRPGLDVQQNGNSIRISATVSQDWKCWCDGTVDSEFHCSGEYRCPAPIKLLDFTVSNCWSN